MALDPIVERLRAERDRIDAALKALEADQPQTKRVMSPEARAKISKAMKSRWSKLHRGNKPAKAASAPSTSANQPKQAPQKTTELHPQAA